jgi:hypothetical protein
MANIVEVATIVFRRNGFEVGRHLSSEHVAVTIRFLSAPIVGHDDEPEEVVGSNSSSQAHRGDPAGVGGVSRGARVDSDTAGAAGSGRGVTEHK